MKIKLDKQLLQAIGIAVVCALVTTIAILLLSVLSWGFVFAALLILFMPISQGAIKFYKQEKFYDIVDFIERLFETEKSKQIEEDDDVFW